MNLAKELRRIADLVERSELAPGFAVDVFNLADGTFRYDLRFVLRHPPQACAVCGNPIAEGEGCYRRRDEHRYIVCPREST